MKSNKLLELKSTTFGKLLAVILAIVLVFMGWNVYALAEISGEGEEATPEQTEPASEEVEVTTQEQDVSEAEPEPEPDATADAAVADTSDDSADEEAEDDSEDDADDDDEAGDVVVNFSMTNATVNANGSTYGDASSITVKDDADFDFSVAVDDGYQLVRVEASGQGELSPISENTYRITEDALADGMTVTVVTEAVPEEEEPAEAASSDGEDTDTEADADADADADTDTSVSFDLSESTVELDGNTYATGDTAQVETNAELGFTVKPNEGYQVVSVSATGADGEIAVSADIPEAISSDEGVEGEYSEDEYTDGEEAEASEVSTGADVPCTIAADAVTGPITITVTTSEVSAEEADKDMPAQTLTATADDGAVITVEAPEGALPAGCTLTASLMDSSSV